MSQVFFYFFQIELIIKNDITRSSFDVRTYDTTTYRTRLFLVLLIIITVILETRLLTLIAFSGKVQSRESDESGARTLARYRHLN